MLTPASKYGSAPLLHPALKALSLLLLIWLTTGCASIKEPRLETVDQLGLREIGKGKAVLNMNLVLQNPNGFGVTLRKARGMVWMDGKLLGNFSCDSTIRVSRLSRFTVPLVLELETKGLLGNSLSLLLKNEVEIVVKGKLKAGKGGFFFSYPIDYRGKQKTANLLPLAIH